MADWNQFAAFMQRVQDAQSRLALRPHQECFFRGHADSGYRLQPSLFRRPRDTWEDYWKLERRVFYEFRTRARQLYDAENSDWDVLFHMQHHGVPTRLLDWTSVLGVALYFALLNHRDGADRPACVWLLNPYALNAAAWNQFRLYHPKYLARDESINRSYDYGELLLGTRPRQWGWRSLWETPLAIYAHQRSDRMYAQSGWFTIHGADLRPMDEIFAGRSGILERVDLPPAAVPAARAFLRAAGIGHRQLFPDLDGVARSVSERFGLT
jgi:hypothetical protein